MKNHTFQILFVKSFFPSTISCFTGTLCDIPTQSNTTLDCGWQNVENFIGNEYFCKELKNSLLLLQAMVMI